jgi:hypothetical protein
MLEGAIFIKSPNSTAEVTFDQVALMLNSQLERRELNLKENMEHSIHGLVCSDSG